MSHAEARKYINASLLERYGYADREAALAVGGVAILETSEGKGWKGAGRGSNNMGAITAGSRWKGMTFEYRDSRPGKDGKDIVYVTKFRKYATPAEGYDDLANVVLHTNGRDVAVRPAAEAGDFYGVSQGLYRTVYYTGLARDPTPAARIARHYSALYRSILAITGELGEDEPMNQLPREPKPEPGLPILMRGSGYAANNNVRDLVRHLQRDLHLVADGRFGPRTEKTVRIFQSEHHLKRDGKVGPETYKALGWAA